MTNELSQAGPATTGVIVGRRPAAVGRAIRTLRSAEDLPEGPVRDAALRAHELARRWEDGAAELRTLLGEAKAARAAHTAAAADALLDGGKPPKSRAAALYARAEERAEGLNVIGTACSRACDRFDEALAEDEGKTLAEVEARRRDAVTEAAELVEAAAVAVEHAQRFNPMAKALNGSVDTHLDDMARDIRGVGKRVAQRAEPPRAFALGDLVTAQNAQAARAARAGRS